MTGDYRWLGRLAIALLIIKMVSVIYTQTIEPWWWRYVMWGIIGSLAAAFIRINEISDWIDRRNEGEHEDHNEQR